MFSSLNQIKISTFTLVSYISLIKLYYTDGIGINSTGNFDIFGVMIQIVNDWSISSMYEENICFVPGAQQNWHSENYLLQKNK